MFNRIPLIAWFLVPTIILVGLGVWFFSRPTVLGEKADSDKPIAVSQPVAGVQEFKIVGREHVAPGTLVTTYNSDPPTSGPHWPQPVKNGVYDSQFPDEQIIHNLEHGYIWISYLPGNLSLESTDGAKLSGISEDEKKRLEEIVRDDNWKIVLEPREANDAKIVLAAWGRLLKMDELDENKVKEFIRTYRNRGPENTPE